MRCLSAAEVVAGKLDKYGIPYFGFESLPLHQEAPVNYKALAHAKTQRYFRGSGVLAGIAAIMVVARTRLFPRWPAISDRTVVVGVPRACFGRHGARGQLDRLDEDIGLADDAIKAMAKADESARRLMSIPGIGPVTASAIAASVQDVSSFSGSREFSAYLGMTPRQNSSGGKERLGRVLKMGNRYLRKLLVVGAHAVLYNRKGHDDALRTWACKLMETKPFKLVAVALANKVARIAFAVMRDQTPYSAKPLSPAQA